MVACADIEFEVDKVSNTDSNKSSHHNVTHSEDNQTDLTKKSFFQLDPNWGKKKLCLTLSRNYYHLHKSSLQMMCCTIN